VKYLAQLDGLRAFAVLGVLATHFLAADAIWGWGGHLGVRLFFVISGFLITTILLDARHDAEDAGGSKRSLAGRFYVKRALRLLPLFYAVILIAYIVNFQTIRETALWHALYASNFSVIHRQSWEGSISHFWTLSVEEQFYLVWPALILWATRRHLRTLMVIVIAGAIVFRAIAEPVLGLTQFTMWMVPISVFDCLAMGALLAATRVSHDGSRERFDMFLRRASLPALALGIAMIVVLATRPPVPPTLVWRTFESAGNFAWVIAFAALVARASQNRGDTAGWFLGWGPVAYVGKISYGIYVLHNFVPHFVGPALAAAGVTVTKGDDYYFTVMTLATIAIAAASWHLYEAPINRLRHRIAYVKERGTDARTVQADRGIPMTG
jgi:peptidoglycan/LPS O-acetylase OafA/YrhL